MSLAKTMFRAVRNCLSRKCWKLLFVLNFRFLTIYKNRFWNYSYKIDIENILYESLKFMINLLRIEMQFLILFSKVNEDKCEETKPISIAHMHTDNGRYTRLKYLILWSIVHHLEKKKLYSITNTLNVKSSSTCFKVSCVLRNHNFIRHRMFLIHASYFSKLEWYISRILKVDLWDYL